MLWMLPQPILMEMVLTGDLVPVERLHDLGFVNYVEATPDEVRARARHLAKRIRDNAPMSVRAGKQALNSAMAAGDTVRMAADTAAAMAGALKGRLGLVMGNAVDAGLQSKAAAKQAEAQAAVARFKEHQLEQATQPAKQQATDQLAQQLIQQLPQQAAQMGQQVAQLPQQAVQQLTQVGQQLGQQVSQFGSQIGNLMGQVAPEYRLDNPGFFDTHPSSPTLDRLAGSGAGGSMPVTALMRVPSLGGLSGVSSGFRFPAGWDGATLTSAVTPPAAGAPGLPPGAGRGMGGMPLHAARRPGEDDESVTIKRPDTELSPLWGEAPNDPDTVSPAELVHHLQEASR
jgi:hypothetical protein